MQSRIGKSKVVGLLALAVAPLFAHHSPSAEFNMDKPVAVAGTLTKVDWINPHIALALEAKGADGKSEVWNFQSNPPAWFRRVGVNRADLAKAIGQKVTIECVRAKDGSAFGYMQKITFQDGHVLELAQIK